ncbi:MAG: DUF4377 domain-containing protein [Chitinophagales bacterium]|nr:DUF4377 domain-containing protein [Chitinophagales bacterium]
MKKILGIFSLSILLLFACKSGEKATTSAANIENWIVAPALVDCGAGDGTQCLQVKRNGAMDYEVIQQPLTGFEYEPGYKYSLEVQSQVVKGVPTYKLITQLFKIESK